MMTKTRHTYDKYFPDDDYCGLLAAMDEAYAEMVDDFSADSNVIYTNKAGLTWCRVMSKPNDSKMGIPCYMGMEIRLDTNLGDDNHAVLEFPGGHIVEPNL